MKKVSVLLVMMLLVCSLGFAQEIRTRQYTPTIKQADYTTQQINTDIWIPVKSHAVLDAYTISTNTTQEISLVASDTIVKIIVTASDPVVSPGEFLWKGIRDEVIRVNCGGGVVHITLTGYEVD